METKTVEWTIKGSEKPLPDIQRTPLSGREYYSLRVFFGMVSAMADSQSVLEKRIKSIPNGWRDWRMLQAVSSKMLSKIMLTLPLNKLIQVRTELEHATAWVDVKCTYDKPVRDPYEGLITYVPQCALERITQIAIDSECKLCEKTGKAVKNCRLRHDIDATYHFDDEYADKSKECPYAGWQVESRASWESKV